MRGAVRSRSFSSPLLRWDCTVCSSLIKFPDFSHDHARSRTYRWGEDGIAGVSDTHGLLNIAFAFWNEKECACTIIFWGYFLRKHC